MNFQENDIFLNRFQIIKVLGSGGYGRVYSALDLTDKTYVAIKFSFGDGPTKERNVAEVKYINALNNIESPHKHLTINMKMSLEFKNCVVLVLELMSHTLLHSIRHGCLDSPSKLSACAKEMMEFLCFMTQVNIIHGDIKPENILVHGPSGHIKFADFGLAQDRYVAKTSAIQTLYYRAPEVMLGYTDFDYSVDTWSVGCTLVECLLKRPLFNCNNELEVMQEIAQIIGSPAQEVIERAPNRDKYFQYDVDNEQWLLVGYDFPIIPIGLKMYIKSHCKVDRHDPDFIRFVDLVEGMLQLDPSLRYGAEECSKHPFFAQSDSSDDLKIVDRSGPETPSISNQNGKNVEPRRRNQDDLRDMSQLCHRMNVDKVAMLAATKLYGRIKNYNLVKKENRLAVMTCSIYYECRKRKMAPSFNDLSRASGMPVGRIAKVYRIIRKYMVPDARLRNIPRHQKLEIIDLTTS